MTVPGLLSGFQNFARANQQPMLQGAAGMMSQGHPLAGMFAGYAQGQQTQQDMALRQAAEERLRQAAASDEAWRNRLYEDRRAQAAGQTAAQNATAQWAVDQGLFGTYEEAEPHFVDGGIGPALVGDYLRKKNAADQPSDPDWAAAGNGLLFNRRTAEFKAAPRGSDGGFSPELTAVDKKAILESDEAAMAGSSVINSLEQAKMLSKQAYSGPLASQRGYATSQFGSEAGKATQNLENITTTQALEQLKVIFGAVPTEGERKILLEIQGSVNQDPKVREAIYERAIEMAKRRIEFNKQRASQLRSGEYYAPDAGGATSTPGAAGDLNSLKSKYGLE
jgi:hypothetical protein